MATPGSQRGALRARLVGIGSAVPPTKVSNSQLEGVVETSDEWIAKRTGIRSRNLLAPGMGLSDLASTAAERALKAAGVDPSEVDLVILATSSPYAAHAPPQSLREREADARALARLDAQPHERSIFRDSQGRPVWRCGGCRCRCRCDRCRRVRPDGGVLRLPLCGEHRVAVSAQWRLQHGGRHRSGCPLSLGRLGRQEHLRALRRRRGCSSAAQGGRG